MILIMWKKFPSIIKETQIPTIYLISITHSLDLTKPGGPSDVVGGCRYMREEIGRTNTRESIQTISAYIGIDIPRFPGWNEKGC